MSEKLRPCPFCGGTKICAEKGINLNYCDNCSAESNVEHWNTRPIEDELRKRIAELEEQVWNLNLENERMEEAYWIDESIAPDGTLKPSVRKLLERLEKAETDLRLGDDLVKALDNRIAELEAAQRWIPVSERLPDGGHREFYEVACIHQVFGELALFSKGRWVIYEGENVYDVAKQVKFWRNRQHLPDEVIAVISKGEMNPEVQE